MVQKTNNRNDMFEVRSYSKQELARLYWPRTPKKESAVDLLRRDIRRCRELEERLSGMPNYNVNDKHFQRAQVAVIVDYLGEP